VQIESMISGTPVVASDLPGVRQPVHMTGMGKVAPVGDAAGLSQAILEVLEHPKRYQADPVEIARQFSPIAVAEAYLRLFEELLTELGRS
jgi:glycosyltransferase involved in cell wall biosynthesis